MPSLTTVSRAIVMIVAGVIVVKGWQLYGPSNEQVKNFAAAALETAQTAWNGTAASGNEPPVVDPRSAPPTLAGNAEPRVQPLIESAPQLAPLPKESADSSALAGTFPAPVVGAPPAATDEQMVAKLLAQLQQLGAADAHVVPWGSSGQLYRCFCKAKLAIASPLARHFEAVAGEPTAAVEQVVAKVEAWRTEQQNFLR